MDTVGRIRRGTATSVGLALVASLGVAAPALARDGADEGRAQGACSRSADWELRAKASGGRLEIRLDVDADRRGQKWVYAIRADGSVVASGTRTSRSGGSLRVEVRVPQGSDVDRITATARNTSSREYCRAAVTL